MCWIPYYRKQQEISLNRYSESHHRCKDNTRIHWFYTSEGRSFCERTTSIHDQSVKAIIKLTVGAMCGIYISTNRNVGFTNELQLNIPTLTIVNKLMNMTTLEFNCIVEGQRTMLSPFIQRELPAMRRTYCLGQHQFGHHSIPLIASSINLILDQYLNFCTMCLGSKCQVFDDQLLFFVI